MRAKVIVFGVLAASGILTSGCAFTKSTVKLNFQPQPTAEMVTVDKKIVVQNLRDVRGGDPLLISYKGVGTKTSGTYVAEREVAAIVTDAIRDTLKALNYQVVGAAGDLELSGELLKLDSIALMGFWSGDMDCTIQVLLKLSDAKTGALVWSESVLGFNKKTGLQLDHEGHRKDTTEAALKDLTNKLAASTTFRRAVENFQGQRAARH